MRVLLFLRRLDYGGTERQAVTLASALRERGWDVAVMVLYEGGALERDLEAAGVPLIGLGKKNRWDILSPLMRLRRTLRDARPDVLYTFLNVPNVLGAMFASASDGTKLVWGIRNSGISSHDADWLMRLASWVERKLAGRARLLIANSQAGREHVLRWGVRPDQVRVIPNGIDTNRFSPSARSCDADQIFSPAEAVTLTVGMVGRLSAMKGYPTFLHAAAQVVGVLRDGVRFICVGTGPESSVARLKGLAASLGLRDHVLWLSPHRDIENAYRTFDVLSLSSSNSEGLPNAVAEAMACGVPCVVTDVGDAARLVGDTGWIAPAEDAVALGSALLQALQITREEREVRGRRARARIETNYSIALMVDATAAALACH